MDFDPTDEQQQLADAVGTLLTKRYDSNARLELLESATGWSPVMWRQYAEMGLLGLTFDEKYGGAGMGVAELATVMECFGRALVLEPFIASVVLGGELVARAGSPEQRADLLPRVAAGELQLAFAGAEPRSRWSMTVIETAAQPTGDGWSLTGEKTGVLGGDSAGCLVVSAVTPAGHVGLFLVDATDVTRFGYAQQDGLRAADLVLAATPAQLLGTELADARAVIGDVIDLATAAMCAEAVGAMDRMLWLTVDYLKTRRQFGTPISAFQALQHRAADMYVSLEQARSMALMAQLALAGDDVTERTRAVRAAKLQIDLSARHIGEEAIQLHGGIGMTMEYVLGHYVKRTAVIAKTFDDVDGLLELIGRDGGLVSSE